MSIGLKIEQALGKSHRHAIDYLVYPAYPADPCCHRINYFLYNISRFIYTIFTRLGNSFLYKLGG
jgi:hypothetical protein